MSKSEIKDVRPTKRELNWAYNIAFWGIIFVGLVAFSLLEYAGIHLPTKVLMSILSAILVLFVVLIAIALVVIFIASLATILASITRGTKEIDES